MQTAITLQLATGVKDGNVSFTDSLLISLIGFAIVFLVLIVLMAVVTIMRRVINAAESRRTVAAPETAPQPVAVASNKVPAKGSLGECDLHNIDHKTVALLMAIVADRMQKPLNELRFISIQEVK